MRLAHAQHGRVGVRRVHGLHGREHGLERVVVLDRHDRKRDVSRRDGLAVMEHGVFAQMQGQGLAVGRQFPGFGQIGLRLPVGVVAQRTGEELGAGQGGRGARLHGAVQVPRHLRGPHHQRAAGFGRIRRSGPARHRHHRQNRCKALSCAAHGFPLDVFATRPFMGWLSL
ncbi:hypothetical protein D3C71_1407920 [compost metagenome]